MRVYEATARQKLLLGAELLGADPLLARRISVGIAQLAAKKKVRLPREVKRSLCKTCKMLLVPAATCTSRVQRDSSGLHLRTACFYCGGVQRLDLRAKPQ